MSPSLTVLGAGSILPRPGYGCAGYAIRAAEGAPVTLLDCGPGSVRALGAVGIGVEDVHRVVLSHYHTDHCLDLIALAFARRNPALADRPRLERIGPRGLARIVDGAPAILGSFTEDPDASTHEAAPGEELAVDDGAGGELRLRSVATRHTPEALAWRVEFATGESLLYTGDTGPNPDVAELGRGVDLFVAECSFPDDAAVEHHLTPTSAAGMARDAGARSLVLSHFYPETDPAEAGRVAAEAYAGPIHLARDGAVFRLG